MFQYAADAIVTLTREEGEVQVHLAHGGEQFPWAEYNGKVYIGPPGPGRVDLGEVALSELKWNVSPFWVIEALDHQGQPCNLTPEEYRKAVSRDRETA